MIPLTNKDIKSYEKQRICHICKKKFYDDDKNKKKVRDHCPYTGNFRGAAHSECNLRYNVPGKIPILFHNGSTYDYHFVIKFCNLSGAYDKECKKCMEKKIRLNCEFTRFKSGIMNYKCKECKKSYTKVLSKSNFPTFYKFCNGDLNTFFPLLRKGINMNI